MIAQDRVIAQVSAPPASLRLGVRQVTKQFSRRVGGASTALSVLSDVSFDVHRGELVSLIGPSGCGKTTLLRIVHQLIDADGGAVFVDGKPVAPGTRAFSMVFQDIRLLPWRTALQNVELGLELQHHRRLTPEERGHARQYLADVGLAEFADSFPHQLSGGMQQRVGVARALALSPDIVLLDEPFGSLDAQTRWVMQDLFLSLQSRYGLTVVLVTHDIDEAVYMSSRCLVMSRRPGCIKEIVTIDLPTPRDTGTRGDPRFGEYRTNVWDLLRSEARQASVEVDA